MLQTVRVESPHHGTRRIQAKNTLKIDEFFRKVCKLCVIIIIVIAVTSVRSLRLLKIGLQTLWCVITTVLLFFFQFLPNVWQKLNPVVGSDFCEHSTYVRHVCEVTWWCCWLSVGLAASSPGWAPPHSGLLQATYTSVLMSLSCIIWYRPREWSLWLWK